MSETAWESPLALEGVARILRVCAPVGLLVGGQALAFWSDHLGVEQAHLAIDLIRAYFSDELAERGGRVADIATVPVAKHVFVAFGIDPLGAAPGAVFRQTAAFVQRRSPQVRRRVAKQRAALRGVLAQG